MNEFKEEITKIKERINALNVSLADIKNALRKRFEKVKLHRKENLENLGNVVQMHNDCGVKFSACYSDGKKISYEIEKWDDDGPYEMIVKINGPDLHREIHMERIKSISSILCIAALLDDEEITCIDDITFVDDVYSVYKAIRECEDKDQMVDKVLEACLVMEEERIEEMKVKLDELKANLLHEDKQ